MLELRVCSIKEAEKRLQGKNIDNVKAILISSYEDDINCIGVDDKLLLKFDDIVIQGVNSFNSELAKKIIAFLNTVNFEKKILYICCDSGISRSSAIAAAILRKYNQNEFKIWRDCEYTPNILVYKILCDSFGIKNSKLRLKYLQYINQNALKRKIKKLRNLRLLNLFKILNNKTQQSEINNIR